MCENRICRKFIWSVHKCGFYRHGDGSYCDEQCGEEERVFRFRETMGYNKLKKMETTKNKQYFPHHELDIILVI